jgi:hypothetical protein
MSEGYRNFKENEDQKGFILQHKLQIGFPTEYSLYLSVCQISLQPKRSYGSCMPLEHLGILILFTISTTHACNKSAMKGNARRIRGGIDYLVSVDDLTLLAIQWPRASLFHTSKFLVDVESDTPRLLSWK